MGSRVRRWWYGVNNWEIPGVKGGKGMMAEEVDEVSCFWGWVIGGWKDG